MPPTITTYTLSGLTAGTSHTFWILLKDSGGGYFFSPTSTFSTTKGTTTTKVGDINGDGHVNVFDLSLLLSHWQQTSATAAPEDLNKDGIVNIFDLSILLGNYGS